MRDQPDALTEVLRTAGLCGFILLAFIAASFFDPAVELEVALKIDAEVAAAQQQAQDEAEARVREEMLGAVRGAYRAGLVEGAERERYARQRALADVEGVAP